MPHTKTNKPTAKSVKQVLLSPFRAVKRKWQKGFWSKLLLSFLAFLMLWVGGMYAAARWYIARHAHEPLTLGMTFIPGYARYFDLDPQETMQAMIDDLGIKHFRLVSYWDDIEKTPGTYDFSELDWQFEKVKAAGGDVSLSIGLRQPRWPECHMPDWAAKESKDQWYPQLKEFMGKVIDRYGNNSILKSYQLENEFFLSVFGICPDHSRDRLVDEFNFVKQKDPDTPIIISRSNNIFGIPLGAPRADEFGISIYKRVWDKTVTKRYFEYPMPAWFYASFAGVTELMTGKDTMVHELQTEAWLPEGFDMRTASIAEQDKSLSASGLKGRFDFAKAAGMRRIDAWGGEWWYFRKVKLGDDSLWKVAKQEYQQK